MYMRSLAQLAFCTLISSLFQLITRPRSHFHRKQSSKHLKAEPFAVSSSVSVLASYQQKFKSGGILVLLGGVCQCMEPRLPPPGMVACCGLTDPTDRFFRVGCNWEQSPSRLWCQGESSTAASVLSMKLICSRSGSVVV